MTCLGSSSFETDIAYGGLISQTSEWLLLFLVGPKAADGGGGGGGVGDRGSYIYHLTSAPPQWHSLCEEKGGTAELASWTFIVYLALQGLGLQASLSVGHTAFPWGPI